MSVQTELATLTEQVRLTVQTVAKLSESVQTITTQLNAVGTQAQVTTTTVTTLDTRLTRIESGLAEQARAADALRQQINDDKLAAAQNVKDAVIEGLRDNRMLGDREQERHISLGGATVGTLTGIIIMLVGLVLGYLMNHLAR